MSGNILRDKMERSLKAELRELAIQTRSRLNLTQEKMGERYAMNGDSFRAIEAGEYMCSTLTAFLLLRDQKDRDRIFDEIGEILDEIRREELIAMAESVH